MPPAPALSPAALLQELQRIAETLAGNEVQGPERLALLRRQATLGDLRESLAERERRGTA